MTYGAHVVSPGMVNFLAMHAEVELDLVLSDRVVDLVEEGVEAAFRIGPIVDQNLAALPLAPYRMVICASPEYLANWTPQQKPGDLAGHECLGFTYWSRRHTWRLERDGVDHQAVARDRYQINSGEGLRMAALAGHGVVMQPLVLLSADIAAGRLVRLLPDYEPPSRPVHLVHLPDRRATPKLRAFLSFAAARFS